MPFKVYRADELEAIGYPIIVIAIEGPERGEQTRTVDSFVMMVEPHTGKAPHFQFRTVAYNVPEAVVSNDIIFLNERLNASAACLKLAGSRRRSLALTALQGKTAFVWREVDPAFLLCAILQNQWTKESLRIQIATECKELKNFLSKDTSKWTISSPPWESGDQGPAPVS